MAENDAFALEAKLGMAVFASDDAKEGPRAFAEKRKPDFNGQLAARLRRPERRRCHNHDALWAALATTMPFAEGLGMAT